MGIFPGYVLLCWHVLTAVVLLSPKFQDFCWKICSPLNHSSPIGNVSLHSVFPLSLVFNILIFMFLRHGFLCFFFLIWDFFSLLESFYDFWETREIFNHHFFKCFFSTLLFLYSSCGTPMTQLLNIFFFLSFCPISPQSSVQDFEFIFSLLYRWNYSYSSVFKTTDSFLCHSFLVLGLSLKVLFCYYIVWFYNSHL